MASPVSGWSSPGSNAGSRASKERTSGMFKHDLQALTLAACKDDETAADASFGGRYSGAFTYALRQMLEHAEGDISWHELFNQARQTLKRQDFDQTPELYGLDALKRSHAFGGGRNRNSRTSAPTAAPTDRGVRGTSVAALDPQIGQLESAGNWSAAAQALQARVATVDSVEEKTRTLEHMVGLYRVKLHDERGVVRVAEQLIAVNSRHEGAAQYLRAVYAQTCDCAKLQQLDTHVAQASRAAPQGQAQSGGGGPVVGDGGGRVGGVGRGRGGDGLRQRGGRGPRGVRDARRAEAARAAAHDAPVRVLRRGHEARRAAVPAVRRGVTTDAT